MSKIAIVEDDPIVRSELNTFLNQNGFKVIAPERFDDLFSCFKEQMPDLILLDVQLGETDGFELCRGIRKYCPVPVIFVTSRSSEADELTGLRLGGDDYITKPYSLPVLLMRIRKCLERSAGGDQGRLTVDGVTLDIVFGQLSFEGGVLELSKKEQQILYYLFMNKGRTVSRDELIEYLWENRLFVDENILNVNLSRIRKRLEGTAIAGFIQTVPKKGYRVGSAAALGKRADSGEASQEKCVGSGVASQGKRADSDGTSLGKDGVS